ncbi:hypothetical protein C0J52_00268 [Blattella germanica]|nr:hypothetical protein C0J52_00268 [Blattella germanica]
MFQTVALNVKCLTDNAKEIVNHAVSCGKENDVVLDDMMEVMNDTCEKKYKCTLACLLDAVMLLQEDGNMAIDFIYYIIELAPHEEVKKELRVLFDSCESQGKNDC